MFGLFINTVSLSSHCVCRDVRIHQSGALTTSKYTATVYSCAKKFASNRMVSKFCSSARQGITICSSPHMSSGGSSGVINGRTQGYSPCKNWGKRRQNIMFIRISIFLLAGILLTFRLSTQSPPLQLCRETACARPAMRPFTPCGRLTLL